MSDLQFGRDEAHEIVIVGGGFGGVYTALELEKTLRAELHAGLVKITLVARDNFFLFTPMLHEVAAGDLNPAHIVNPLHSLLKHTQIFCGEVESLDLPHQRLNVRHGGSLGAHSHAHTLTYDQLVLAPGSVANFAGVPGVEENALTMRTLGDAIGLRERLIRSLEIANADCFAQMRAPWLTVVIAGGGFSGVETAGAVNDFLRDAVEHYNHLHAESVRVVLVHGGERVLPELGAKLGDYATRELAKNGIEVQLNARVAAYENDTVVLDNGERIAAQTLVWTVGNAPSPILGMLPAMTQRGRIQDNEFLEVPEWPGVWSLGDAAHALDENGVAYPPTAQHALRQGRVVASNIAARLRGTRKTAFRFKSLGQLATIGRRAGVANMMGAQFSGVWAWAAWRAVYLMKLPRLEKKIRVALDWTLDLFFARDLTQLSSPLASGARPMAIQSDVVRHESAGQTMRLSNDAFERGRSVMSGRFLCARFTS